MEDIFVRNTGDAMTGQLTIAYNAADQGAIEATNSNDTGRAVFGHTTGTTGINYGGYFEADGTFGVGVLGVTHEINGTGVYGKVEDSGIFAGRFDGDVDINGDLILDGDVDLDGKLNVAENTAGARTVEASNTSASGYSGWFAGGNFVVNLGATATEGMSFGNLPTSSSAANTRLDYNGTTNRHELKVITSSERYKEDIRNLEVEKSETLKLQGVKFRDKASGREEIGLIAEDVYNLVPDLVELNGNKEPEGVKYDRISVYLLEVIKEQQDEINDLKTVVCDKYPSEDICK